MSMFLLRNIVINLYLLADIKEGFQIEKKSIPTVGFPSF